MDLLLKKVNRSSWNICVICRNYIRPQKNLQQNPLNNLRATNPSLPPCLTAFQGNTPWGKSNAFHTPMMTLLFQDLALQNTPTGNYGGKRGIVNGMEIVSQKGCDFCVTTRTPQKNQYIKHRVIKVQI